MRDGAFVLDGEEAAHLSRVARARTGDTVRLFDGAGSSWRGRIERIGRGVVEGKVLEPLAEAKPAADVRLYLSLVARSAFEDALEKTTELGVSELHPIWTERSARFGTEDAPKLKRWRQILVAACKQCERARLPELFEPASFSEALKDGPGWLAHFQKSPSPRLGEGRVGGSPIRVFIGPEGGFTDAEAALAAAAGFRTFSLGANVLRAETAAVAACARFLADS